MASQVLKQPELLRLANMYHLLGDPNRLKVMLACSEQATAVSDIAAQSGVSLSLVSHHLRLLRMGGLVAAERRGRQVFYTIADGHVGHMLADMVAHVTQCRVGASSARARKPVKQPADKRVRSVSSPPLVLSNIALDVPALLPAPEPERSLS